MSSIYIEKGVLLRTFDCIDAALKAEKYVVNCFVQDVGKHFPIVSDDDGVECFGPSLVTGRSVWLGWDASDFMHRGVDRCLHLCNAFKRGLSLRVYPTKVTGFITVDDIDSSAKEEAFEAFSPAILIQSSQFSKQAILKVALYQDNLNIAFEALKLTSKELNRVMGDDKVGATSQGFRFPHTYNNKTKHVSKEYPHGFLVQLLKSGDVFCTQAQHIYNDTVKTLLASGFYGQVEVKECPIAEVDFKPRYAVFGKPEHIYYAHAHLLYYTLTKHGGKSLQGHLLDRFVAARLKALGYTLDEIALVLSKKYSRLCASIRHKDNAQKQAESNGKIVADLYEIPKQSFKDSYLLEYGDSFKAKTGEFERAKKNEKYWCKRLGS